MPEFCAVIYQIRGTVGNCHVLLLGTPDRYIDWKSLVDLVFGKDKLGKESSERINNRYINIMPNIVLIELRFLERNRISGKTHVRIHC